MCVPHPGITCSWLLCCTLPQLYLSLSLDAAPFMCQTPLMNYVRHLNQFGTTVVVWYGKRAKFDRVCGTFLELNLGLTHRAPSESDVAPVLLQSQTYSIRFGTWQVQRLDQALFYHISSCLCCFYSVILNCLIDNYCSQFSFRLLVLHLKRYEYDNLTEEQAKKQDKVNIERFIDLSKCQG